MRVRAVRGGQRGAASVSAALGGTSTRSARNFGNGNAYVAGRQRQGGRPRALAPGAKVKSAQPTEDRKDDFEEYSATELIGQQDQEEEPRVRVNVDVGKVKNFILKMVNSTDIAEIDLQVGDMELYIMRKIDSEPAPAAPAAAPTPVATAATPEPAAPVAMASLEEASVDETTVYLTSETVGTFRRGRYAKGKKIGNKAMVEEGGTVKKGQTIAFVEQMGTYTPVLANQAGEIASFELEDGDPVGYGQALVSLHPFFGGHIIGESKHV
ncbi:lipoyl-binding domain-containing protein [Chloropicon primus]|uniref:Lipoyl-binding domain-containing protein n=1 Tax=Chloropicon primus TaxID=1764295 RepID=A0A5B8MDM8_9CHLO|nr:hypothetical protein A3770_02p10510 [Chloropicon primus]UPQ97742.1 lipoyl-binding domain-containing protein [Chloropicon primus]|mmetsp:Transcript_8521/g.24349  ORF Transcript_8521/g.24349 Transcript_8521/m.24349 type:complete len:268 (+) Transcript_8521:98-901(+)|eukprot:QDZ18533.1 hypothetical protein A3770_02p10510 [Chloropicon primus]